MKLRHEIKHELRLGDLYALRSRLPLLLRPDPHGDCGRYQIRSLYFDNLYDKALLEKINGTDHRTKFRLRYYNGDTSYIVLERKSRHGTLSEKKQEEVSIEEAGLLSEGRISDLLSTDKPLLRELLSRMSMEGLRPKTIVDYTREAFIFPQGNARVTLDTAIHTGMYCTDFLDPDCVTVPAGGPAAVLEVKWDEFLPSGICDIIRIPGIRAASFSKYEISRIYG